GIAKAKPLRLPVPLWTALVRRSQSAPYLCGTGRYKRADTKARYGSAAFWREPDGKARILLASSAALRSLLVMMNGRIAKERRVILTMLTKEASLLLGYQN